MENPAFDFAGTFDEDYLYFYEPILTAERTDAEVGSIWTLLDMAPGIEVLDLACGHGRIANRLAIKGAKVVGLDATPMFLRIAEADASKLGVDVEWVQGDMRSIPWTGRFDRIINWFTAFGYFDDTDNRTVLRGAHDALKPGGRLLIELGNRDAVLRGFRPHMVTERDGNYMIDRHRFDPISGRIYNERIIVRDGKTRTTGFFVRTFTFTELRDWLLEAGFSAVEGFGPDGNPFTLESRRMIMVATK